MRIGLALAHRSVVGGAEAYVRTLLPALSARGHELAMLHELSSDDRARRIDRADTPLVRLCVEELGEDAALDGLARWRPDVVYAQGLRSASFERRLVRGHRAVLYAHSYYGTCVSGNKRHTFPELAMCERAFGPACLAVHYARRCGGLNPLATVELYRLQARRHGTLAEYRAVLVASEHMRREFGRNGVQPERLHVVPLPPADVEPDPAPPQPRASSGTLLLVGRVTDLKGGGVLMDAVPLAARALGRSLRVVVVGDGPARAALATQARASGVDAEFVPWISPERRTELMREAELLVVPSVWPEPYGLVGLEAACVGLPAVGFSVGGIPDWLEPGVSGELASGDPPTVRGLADAIGRALADREHHARLCRGAWAHARGVTLARHVDRLERVLASAAEA